jgi:hypothetical protein
LPKGIQWVEGTIDSVFEQSGDLIICASVHPKKAEVAALVTPKQKKPEGANGEVATAGAKPLVRLDHWPLKVAGYTFTNRFDFEAVVRKGCTNCAKVPMWNNAFNHNISIVKPEGLGTGLLRPHQLDFVCGRCNTDAEEVAKIMERLNAV